MAEDAFEAATESGETAAEEVNEDAETQPVNDGATDLVDSWGTAYSSAVRVAAGVVGVLADRAHEAANSAPAHDREESPAVEGLSTQSDVPGMVLFGLAADLPTRFGRMTASIGDNTGFVRDIVGYGWRVTTNSPVGWLMSKPIEAVLQRVEAEAGRLSEIGRSEVAQGKALVETVVDSTIDGVLDNVSESDALNELIREQAFGITDSAIQEVRETGAAADNLTDSAIRKILRREPRALPPRPANGR